MLNQQEGRPLSIGSAVQFTHKGETIHGHLLQRQGRRRFAKVIDTEERIWKVPESALKHSGGTRRATMVTRHDKARADYRVGDEVTFTWPRRTKAWRDREAQPEESEGTLRKDMLERPLWPAPRGGKGKRAERRGAAERRCGNGSATDGRAWAHGLDPRVRRGQEAPWRLPFPTPRDPDQPHPCPGGKQGADPGHRAARDRTRDRGTRGGPWTAVEGNGTANRSNTKGEGLRELSEAEAGIMSIPATVITRLPQLSPSGSLWNSIKGWLKFALWGSTKVTRPGLMAEKLCSRFVKTAVDGMFTGVFQLSHPQVRQNLLAIDLKVTVVLLLLWGCGQGA